MRSSAVKWVLALPAFGTVDVVRAQVQEQDWPRFHIGVAMGLRTTGLSHSLSEVGGVPEEAWGDLSVESDDIGWKLVAGFRPLRIVGAELQYVDFGEGTRQSRNGGQVPIQAVTLQSSADAKVLTAILFVPEHLRSFDFYGKVGVADLDDSFTVSGYDRLIPGCRGPPFPVAPECDFDIEADQSESAPYVGLGVRLEIASAVAVRFEYEAIDRDEGDGPSMLSLGIAWEF